MIHKLPDGTRVRTRHLGDDAGTVEFETYRFTPEKETLSVVCLDGDEAKERLDTLSVLDAIRFGREYGASPKTSTHTGRPSRLPFRAGLVAASVTTVAALAFVITPDAQAPEYPLLKDVVSAPVVTPGERTVSHTDRGGKRETLAPSALPSADVK